MYTVRCLKWLDRLNWQYSTCSMLGFDVIFGPFVIPFCPFIFKAKSSLNKRKNEIKLSCSVMHLLFACCQIFWRYVVVWCWSDFMVLYIKRFMTFRMKNIIVLDPSFYINITGNIHGMKYNFQLTKCFKTIILKSENQSS